MATRSWSVSTPDRVGRYCGALTVVGLGLSHSSPDGLLDYNLSPLNVLPRLILCV